MEPFAISTKNGIDPSSVFNKMMARPVGTFRRRCVEQRVVVKQAQKAGSLADGIGSVPACVDRSPRVEGVEAWVDEHGHYLYGYALLRVRDRHIAEDLVQETFLAALRSAASFRGSSSPRTWLVSLMRRKIADHYRKNGREGASVTIDIADPTIDAWFSRRGTWIKRPHRCELDPAVLQQRADFWVVFEHCLQGLPPRLASAFSLKVVDHHAPAEVCKLLSITSTNLWVVLHRARARLRACLEGCVLLLVEI